MFAPPGTAIPWIGVYISVAQQRLDPHFNEAFCRQLSLRIVSTDEATSVTVRKALFYLNFVSITSQDVCVLRFWYTCGFLRRYSFKIWLPLGIRPSQKTFFLKLLAFLTTVRRLGGFICPFVAVDLIASCQRVSACATATTHVSSYRNCKPVVSSHYVSEQGNECLNGGKPVFKPVHGRRHGIALAILQGRLDERAFPSVKMLVRRSKASPFCDWLCF